MFLRSSHKYNLRIFEIEKIKLRSGSLRFYCCRTKNKRISSNTTKKLLKEENRIGFNKLSYLKQYNKRIFKTKTDIIKNIKNLKKKNKKIFGYGASGRGTIIMNYCGLKKNYLDFVVDDAPAKKGKYTPGTHVKIISWDDLKKIGYPDYFVLFAWPFQSEIFKKRSEYIKNGGKFIIPLPEVKIRP